MNRRAFDEISTHDFMTRLRDNPETCPLCGETWRSEIVGEDRGDAVPEWDIEECIGCGALIRIAWSFLENGDMISHPAVVRT